MSAPREKMSYSGSVNMDLIPSILGIGIVRHHEPQIGPGIWSCHLSFKSKKIGMHMRTGRSLGSTNFV